MQVEFWFNGQRRSLSVIPDVPAQEYLGEIHGRRGTCGDGSCLQCAILLGGRVVTTAPAARPVSQATPKPCSRSPLLRPKSCPRLFWRRAETSGSSFCSESSTTRSSLHISAFWLCQLDLHAEFTAARCSSGWHHASLL